jgi:hypothetical protein
MHWKKIDLDKINGVIKLTQQVLIQSLSDEFNVSSKKEMLMTLAVPNLKLQVDDVEAYGIRHPGNMKS